MASLPLFLNNLLVLLGDQLADLTIRRNFSPVPDRCTVLRLARPSKDYQTTGRISAVQLAEEFQLSSEDKNSVPPHLSVWDASLTTPTQAYAFLQDNNPRSPRKLVLSLNVGSIRAIEACVSIEKTYPRLLNVIRVYLFQSLECSIKDRRPGASGHAGICGLDQTSLSQGLTNAELKRLRKDLRAKLADLASQNHYLLPD
jgi:hypothetical protein